MALTRIFILAFALLLSACSESGSPAVPAAKPHTILDDISGVWRAQNDGTMVSLVSNSGTMKVLFGERPIPVDVGSIDTTNKTVNFNVVTTDGKKRVWTVRQVFAPNKETFHLILTLDDGTQDELSFVRKISNDDLTALASAESKSDPISLPQPTTSPASATNNTSTTAKLEEAVSTEETEGICKGLDLAITADQLDCIGKKFEISDAELNRLYKALMTSLEPARKASLQAEQRAWIKEKQTKCKAAGKEFEGGTMATVLSADCELQMTTEREKYLAAYR